MEISMWWLAMMACLKMDAEPWRMDIKEQQVLYAAAEEYWLGVRWGELGRSSQYIEDPLERARFLNTYVPGQYIDIKVLHATLEPLEEILRSSRDEDLADWNGIRSNRTGDKWAQASK